MLLNTLAFTVSPSLSFRSAPCGRSGFLRRNLRKQRRLLHLDVVPDGHHALDVTRHIDSVPDVDAASMPRAVKSNLSGLIRQRIPKAMNSNITDSGTPNNQIIIIEVITNLSFAAAKE